MTATKEPRKTQPKELTFAEYKKRKIESHSSFINSKSKKSKDEKQTIQIGLMKYDSKTKKLKPARGRLTLDVGENASASDVLTAGIEKYAAFERSFLKNREYALLYQIINIPGSSDPFTLSLYRKASGRSYSRITLYLCTRKDVLLDRLPKEEHFNFDSDSDDLDSEVDSRELITSYLEKKPPVDDCEPGCSSNMTINDFATDAQETMPVSEPIIIEDVSNTVVQNSDMLQCPICFKFFLVQDIAEHADTCNNWQLDHSSNDDSSLPAVFDDYNEVSEEDHVEEVNI